MASSKRQDVEIYYGASSGVIRTLKQGIVKSGRKRWWLHNSGRNGGVPPLETDSARMGAYGRWNVTQDARDARDEPRTSLALGLKACASDAMVFFADVRRCIRIRIWRCMRIRIRLYVRILHIDTIYSRKYIRDRKSVV